MPIFQPGQTPPPPPDDAVWLTLAEAAKRLRVSPDTVRRMVARGDLATYGGPFVGHRYRRDEVDAVLLKEQP